MKTCTKCGKLLSYSEFSKHKNNKDGYDSQCKLCKKEYYNKNNDKIKLQRKDYRKINKIKLCEYGKIYHENNKNNSKERKREYDRNYRKNKRKTDIKIKLKDNIGCLIRNSIKRRMYTKKSRTYEILGCDFFVLKEYLENQFDENMSWDNHGIYWDIDHIIPLSSAITEEDIIKLNHYTNLQPLKSYINRYVKRDNI